LHFLALIQNALRHSKVANAALACSGNNIAESVQGDNLLQADNSKEGSLSNRAIANGHHRQGVVVEMHQHH